MWVIITLIQEIVLGLVLSGVIYLIWRLTSGRKEKKSS